MLRRSARNKVEVKDAPLVPPVQPVVTVKRAANKRPKKALTVEPEFDPVPKPQRRRGKLRFITEMPLDILFEIFGQLYPLDLLSISRSSKALRDITLRKSAAFLWKQAFLNITPNPPPPCPDDLNEAQYANLLWGKHCFFCGISASVVAWQCRVRTCQTCIYTSKFTPLRGDESLAGELCCNWYFSASLGHVCLTSDLELLKTRLNELTEGPDKEDFILLSQQITKAKVQHASLCHNWEYFQKLRRKQGQKDARESRKNAILAKLKELGWSDELSKRTTLNDLSTLPAFKQSKELTERIWTNIEPELVAYLTEARSRRLQDERIVLLRNRISVLSAAAQKNLSDLPISEPRPRIFDLCAMPEYRAILESPSDTEITQGHFIELLSHLPEQMDRWHTSNVEILRRLLPSFKSGSKQQKPDTSSLDLCTTFFRCHSCREPISYPRILSHACIFKGPGNTEEEVDLLSLASHSDSWIHGHKGIAFDTEASNITAMLIKLGGRDPKTLTSGMMDELDARFECSRCPHPRQGRLVMTWKIALLHELEEHYGETLTPKSWKLLNAEDVIAAKELEAKSKKQPVPHLTCLKCNTLRAYTRREVEHHLRFQHIIESVEDNVIRHPDITIRMPPGAVRLRNNNDA
ncbi:hypothetical protein B0H17DRAFT_229933 [Mycena rosella]|uniref:F-box domain-containing protein n=1 Tax=Mycena rosella TaxID=1033263 RepID=A0AAD7MBL3_MYCRO|nr:hypothetical protein B0H17DRAFT_229933 [Mycena rosella]